MRKAERSVSKQDNHQPLLHLHCTGQVTKHIILKWPFPLVLVKNQKHTHTTVFCEVYLYFLLKSPVWLSLPGHLPRSLHGCRWPPGESRPSFLRISLLNNKIWIRKQANTALAALISSGKSQQLYAVYRCTWHSFWLTHGMPLTTFWWVRFDLTNHNLAQDEDWSWYGNKTLHLCDRVQWNVF